MADTESTLEALAVLGRAVPEMGAQVKRLQADRLRISEMLRQVARELTGEPCNVETVEELHAMCLTMAAAYRGNGWVAKSAVSGAADAGPIPYRLAEKEDPVFRGDADPERPPKAMALLLARVLTGENLDNLGAEFQVSRKRDVSFGGETLPEPDPILQGRITAAIEASE